jgi:hypothetical protein
VYQILRKLSQSGDMGGIGCGVNVLLDTYYPPVYAGMTCLKGRGREGAVNRISDGGTSGVGARFSDFCGTRSMACGGSLFGGA